MSLVNQMLKDLEQRRAELPSSDRLRGLRSAPDTTDKALRNRWPLLLIVIALAGSGFGWWIADNGATVSVPPMAQALPIAPVASTTMAATPLATIAVAPAPRLAPVATVVEPPAPTPLEITTVAALEISTPSTPKSAPTVTKPAPKPEPLTATAVAQTPSTNNSTPAGMDKTLRTPSPQELAVQRYNDALHALTGSDLQGAETALRAALVADPSYSKATETLATLLVQQDRRDDAMQVLSASLKQSPLQSQLAMLQARLLADAGRDTEAVNILQTAQATGGADYQALLGTLQQRLGNDTQAAAAYRLALTSSPQRGIWWIGLGISLERSQQSAEALSAYRNALRDTALEAQVSDYVRARIAALDSGQV